MWKTLILALLLSGCGSTITPPKIDTPVYHPSMPVPYMACNISLEVLEVNKQAEVSMSYNDNVTAAICNKDMERYLTELTKITCHYRRELKESICINDR